MLEHFKWKNDTLANCRCPICGDSRSNKTKARGYFYCKNNDMFYRCHNCSVSTNMYRFLETVSPALCKQYSLERWRNGENGHSNYEKPKVKMEQPKFSNINIPTVESLNDAHLCKKYVISRKIPTQYHSRLYYAENFSEFINKYVSKDVGEEPRLIIPIYNIHMKLVGFQGRALDDNNVRYVTIKFDEDEKLCFGVERVDFKSIIYIMEGPIDSLFIPNAVAILGMNHELDSVIFNNNVKVVYVLDNEPRNKQVVQQYEKLINSGKKICIWPSSITGKDVNDMVLRGRSNLEVKRLIDSNTYAGPEARIRFSQWKKV